jgi:predicted enzyme related to lactoylglutathione lyase
MFENSQVFSSFSVDDVPKAKEFYSQTLGIKVDEDEQMGLQLNFKGGNRVFVYPKGEAHQPASFTVLNFIVDDIEKAVEDLKAKGVAFEQYDNEFVKTDEKGIARSTPDQPGPNLAWFKDPAGNVLAVLENAK